MPEFNWDAQKSVRILTLAHSRKSCGAGGGDGVPFDTFFYSIKGWNGLELR